MANVHRKALSTGYKSAQKYHSMQRLKFLGSLQVKDCKQTYTLLFLKYFYILHGGLVNLFINQIIYFFIQGVPKKQQTIEKKRIVRIWMP
jgi:hypothetical protein